MGIVIGVLALQGAFAKHLECLHALGILTCEVRYPDQLKECDGLIIPGGESTTIARLLRISKLDAALKAFAVQKPLFGTCAGLILMSREIYHDATMTPFNLLDITVERNAFGRQIESFSTVLEARLQMAHSVKNQHCQVLFIRAPRIRKIGPEVQVLASYDEEPVLVQQGHHLGATFHAELTPESAIHQHFLHMVKQAKEGRKVKLEVRS